MQLEACKGVGVVGRKYRAEQMFGVFVSNVLRNVNNSYNYLTAVINLFFSFGIEVGIIR